MDIGVAIIMTNGVGSTAYNSLIFGPARVYFRGPRRPRRVRRGRGVVDERNYQDHYEEDYDNDDDNNQYTMGITVSITKRRKVTKEFTVNKKQKEVIIRRLGKINTSIIYIKSKIRAAKEVIFFKWKK